VVLEYVKIAQEYHPDLVKNLV